jgi:hypothetical protein
MSSPPAALPKSPSSWRPDRGEWVGCAISRSIDARLTLAALTAAIKAANRHPAARIIPIVDHNRPRQPIAIILLPTAWLAPWGGAATHRQRQGGELHEDTQASRTGRPPCPPALTLPSKNVSAAVNVTMLGPVIAEHRIAAPKLLYGAS